MQCNTLDCIALGFLQPPLHGQKASPIGYVVDENDAMGASVEAGGQGTEPLLAGLERCVWLVLASQLTDEAETYCIEERKTVRLPSHTKFLNLDGFS